MHRFGVFPLVLARADVGALFVVFGVFEVGGAVACGRLVDRMAPGHYSMLTGGVTATSLLLALIVISLPRAGLTSTAGRVNATVDSLDDGLLGFDRPSSMVLPLVAAATFGLSDSAIAVLAYAQLGKRYRDVRGSARAGATRQMFYSLGFLVGFAVGPYVPATVQLVALLVALVVACVVLTRAASASSRRAA